MIAFLSPHSLPLLTPRQPIPATSLRPLSISCPARSCLHSEPRANVPSPSKTSSLTRRLLEALDGLDRGLSIDPDAATMGKQEALVEDLIEKLEDINTVDIPTKDPRLLGAWQLMYTSSSITRFFGGVTGVQRLLPEGEIGRIVQFIDLENGTSRFTEQVSYELPIVGKTVTSEAVVEGKIRPSSAVRLLWDAERVKMSWFSWFADGWKTMRAFRISDITYLDDNLRITRGQTGSVNVFARLEKD